MRKVRRGRGTHDVRDLWDRISTRLHGVGEKVRPQDELQSFKRRVGRNAHSDHFVEFGANRVLAAVSYSSPMASHSGRISRDI